MITTRDQYAIYDNEVGRLLEVGDLLDILNEDANDDGGC